MKTWLLLAAILSSGAAHAVSSSALPVDIQTITDTSPDDQLETYQLALQYQLRLMRLGACTIRDSSYIAPTNPFLPTTPTTVVATPVITGPGAPVAVATAVNDMNRILINSQAIIIDQSSAAHVTITANYQTDDDKLMRLTLVTDSSQTKIASASVDYLEYQYTNSGSLVSPKLTQTWVDIPSTSYTCTIK